MNSKSIESGGLRNRGLIKKSTDQKPLISIVTVVYNAASTLEATILSTIHQTYENFEYIIVDGGSTDGTLDIIKKYEDRIDYWISEPDKGLYYAMNKGINLANGDWINFMNSGDSFYQNEVLTEMFKQAHQDVDVIYGDVMFSFDGTNAVHVKARTLDYFWKGMPFVHQTSFVRTALMKKHPFDVYYKLIADYSSLYNMYLDGAKFKYLEKIVCNFRAGGLSDNNPESIAECQRMIFVKHRGINVKLYYYKRYVECFVKYNFAKLIGQNNYARLRKIKNK